MTAVFFRRIRVRKQDSAFVYALLEAAEGMATYSTLEQPVGAQYRDLELIIPESFMNEFEDWMQNLREQDSDMIFALPSPDVESNRVDSGRNSSAVLLEKASLALGPEGKTFAGGESGRHDVDED